MLRKSSAYVKCYDGQIKYMLNILINYVINIQCYIMNINI